MVDLMGPLALAVLIGCLNGLQWLLWGTAALAGLLVLVQAVRGDADALPVHLSVFALALALAGAASGFLARRISAR